MPALFSMKAKLNIQSIRIAEKLLKKPFGDFDLSSEGDMQALMYGIVYSNNEEEFTFSTFKTMLTQKKTYRSIIGSVRKSFDIIAQFSEAGEKDENPIYMGDLASTLIMNGLDPHFVNYEMNIFEIPDYLKAIDEKKKDQMERDRLWTYISVMPHVNSKKIKNPSDLIMFPWEVDEKKKKSMERMEQDKSLFEKFINSKK